MDDSGDRRVRRTRQALRQAMNELIIEKGYDRFTVQDLIDRADVGRSTFYSHYETKDDLLISGLQEFAAELRVKLAADPVKDDAILPTLGIFQHLAENQRLFRGLIGSRGIDIAQRRALELLTNLALAGIGKREAAGEHSPVPADARAAFLAGAFMSFQAWWLDSGLHYSPEEMATMFYEMTAGR